MGRAQSCKFLRVIGARTGGSARAEIVWKPTHIALASGGRSSEIARVTSSIPSGCRVVILRVLLACAVCFVCAPSPGRAEVYRVDSIEALTAKIKTAAPGDAIVLKDGVYETSKGINVECVGTAELRITIAAESVGGVEIAGSDGFDVEEPATFVTISGFRFTHAAGKNSIGAGTRFVRFTRNVFVCAGEGHLLSVNGDDAQIDHNDFGPKTEPGTMLAVSGTGTQIARRLWVHHNSFHDFANDGSSGAEMIRFGLLSAHRLSNGAGLVEHNLFIRCRGTNEMISNRASGNTYRYNTFVESPTSHFTIRQGNDCAIYGNIFRRTEGLRFYGDRHRIYSNYFEGNYIAVSVGNGDVEIADVAAAAATSGRDRPDGCLIVFNTFVDNATHVRMSRGGAGALGATGTVFENNLLQGGDAAAKIDGPYTDAIWSGNIVWKTAKARDLPVDGFTASDPLLSAAGEGIRRPSAESPVDAGASGAQFPFVTVDIDGQPRPEKPSIGADEPSAAPAIARLLSPADVGPGADLPKKEIAAEPKAAADAPTTPAAPAVPAASVTPAATMASSAPGTSETSAQAAGASPDAGVRVSTGASADVPETNEKTPASNPATIPNPAPTSEPAPAPEPAPVPEPMSAPAPETVKEKSSEVAPAPSPSNEGESTGEPAAAP